jgi:hypothetical protein
VRNSRIRRRAAVLAAAAVLSAPVLAGDPASASYCAENDRIFWFMTVTDTHIGAAGSRDTDNLSWVVHEGKSVVNPSFIVLSGDITDSTNGNLLGIPNGPHQEEWDEYRATLDTPNTGINAGNFFDLPGNHDAYSDGAFSYYLNNSVQGRATGRTQASWTRQFDFGTYHFLGANTSANDGAAFSLFFPYGDRAGLDDGELAFLGSELSAHSDAALTIVFGHHPMEEVGDSGETWLLYGAPEFAALLQDYGVSSYTYGHTHRFSEAFFTGGEEYGTKTPYSVDPGVFYINIDSLGKSSDHHFNITAVDCNGISTVTGEIGSWPQVMITAPMDRNLGMHANPYVPYTVPRAADNPLRALLFDPDTSVATAEYRIDSTGVWNAMQRVEGNPNLWEASWDAAELAEGEHAVEVRATGSAGAVRMDSVSVYVEGAADSCTDQTASGEIAGTGSVSGSFTDTHLLDGNSETITERIAGEGLSTRYSALEHTWTVPVQPGETMELFARLTPSRSCDGDAFRLSYSTDNISYLPLLTVSDPGEYTGVLPADLEGTLYIRIEDTDHTAGHWSLDSVAVDRLLIRTGFDAVEPPAVP